jgi:predicted alpha-1,2-mannosidase
MRIELRFGGVVWLAIGLVPFVFSGCKKGASKTPSDYVNPFIGTGGHGHTYPGAAWPFGMVQLSPDTRLDGWDGCSGYHDDDRLVYGFSHTHLQGTGVSDYGDILFAPTNSKPRQGSHWNERYSSHFQKENEIAEAGYYRVALDDFQLLAEMTVTERTGIHRYSLLNEADSLTLFIDMDHRDELLEYSFYPLGDSLIVGHRVSKAWATEQHVYFAAKFSEPFIYNDQTFELHTAIDPAKGEREDIMEYVAVFPLIFPKKKSVTAVVALSGTSIEGALKNMEAEAPDFDFDRYRKEAKAAWDKELGRIEVKGGSEDEKTIFYTALYHTFTSPNMWSDTDGAYRGPDGQIHREDGHYQYTVFSLWDTYRSLHPLFNIVQPKRNGRFIESLLRFDRHSGRLPVWELAANETDCMIGYHAVSVMADALAKGVRNFDAEEALDAMVRIAELDELGKTSYILKGAVDAREEPESVSKTLEYAYDDWCIARFAEAIGNEDIRDRFDRRAQHWKNVVDWESGFARAKRMGAWFEPFDPYEVNYHFTEANSWQYTFHVPHDLSGMAKMFGSQDKMLARLDELFTTGSQMTGRQQPDITGMIGQYAHGNEPSHHVAYLFNYLSKPSRTQELTSLILRELYRNAPDGLSGNEDCGQMSAWYVLSAAGIYPVCPGSDVYTLSTPLFDEMTYHLGGDKKFIIKSKNNKSGNTYIQSVSLNGKQLNTLMIRHADITAGGVLEFVLGTKPNDDFDPAPLMESSRIEKSLITPVPVIVAPPSFVDSAVISIIHPQANSSIEFKINDGNFQLYHTPFTVREKTTITARAAASSRSMSPEAIMVTSLRNKQWSLSVVEPHDPQYPGGGAEALIDGLTGGPDYRTGEWQGRWGKDLTATVDLGKIQTVSFAGIRCIRDIRPWIWFPKEVEIHTSVEGSYFSFHKSVKDPFPDNDYEGRVHLFGSELKGVQARFVKIVAKNFGNIPEWHLGKGHKAWLFADEIIIK